MPEDTNHLSIEHAFLERRKLVFSYYKQIVRKSLFVKELDVKSLCEEAQCEVSLCEAAQRESLL